MGKWLDRFIRHIPPFYWKRKEEGTKEGEERIRAGDELGVFHMATGDGR